MSKNTRRQKLVQLELFNPSQSIPSAKAEPVRIEHPIILDEIKEFHPIVEVWLQEWDEYKYLHKVGRYIVDFTGTKQGTKYLIECKTTRKSFMQTIDQIIRYGEKLPDYYKALAIPYGILTDEDLLRCYEYGIKVFSIYVDYRTILSDRSMSDLRSTAKTLGLLLTLDKRSQSFVTDKLNIAILKRMQFLIQYHHIDDVVKIVTNDLRDILETPYQFIQDTARILGRDLVTDQPLLTDGKS